MSIPNFVIKVAYERMGKFVGGPLGAAIGAFSATSVLATEEVFELAHKINKGSASFHDIWRATAAVEAGLYAYGVVGGALGVAAAPGIFVAGVVAAAGIFAVYYRNPTASLDALEALIDGVGEDQPWDIAAAVMKAYSTEIERQKTIDATANTAFLSARAFTLPRDPLVLDLDGDGLELSPASGNVLFDHDADGIKTGTGWARPDDGFLVRDLDGNGLIDFVRELSGQDTFMRYRQFTSHRFGALGTHWPHSNLQ